MTSREKQILHWIKENPMISQEELAQKANIARSSVAVHISNLMKKGQIAGKGYIVKDDLYAVVVGGVNIDICGQSFSPLIARDSNPGFTRMSLGGVGRNIAHNLALLVEVSLLTALGDDSNARLVEDSCSALGIDIRRALRVPGGRTSTYLFLNGPDGDMALAVSDMKICESITPAYLEKNTVTLNHAKAVVIDTNIPEESIRWLTEKCESPVFADPVSVAKAEKLKPYLGRIHTLKPNRLEAEYLSGVKIQNESDLRRAARILLDTGLERVFISMGSDGVFFADHNRMDQVPVYEAQMRNATGAGDAFMAGLVWSYLQGAGLEDAAWLSSAASAIAIEGKETINPEMSVKALLEKAKERVSGEFLADCDIW